MIFLEKTFRTKLAHVCPFFIMYTFPEKIIKVIKIYVFNSEAGRGAAARGVTVNSTGCGFDPHSRR